MKSWPFTITTLTAALIGFSTAKPVADSYASGYGYFYNPGGAPFEATPAQFHAQDELGQYNYGYTNGLSSKQETKTADGVVRGSYSYIDANNEVQRVDYVSDILGFRTVATNLPKVASPAIGYTQASIKAVPVNLATTRIASKPAVLAPTVAYTHLPYATNYGYFYNPSYQKLTPVSTITAEIEPQTTAQIAYHDIPQPKPVVTVKEPAQPVAVVPVEPQVVAQPVVPQITQTQYHAQDELGQYQFGYSDPNSARTETKTADGVVRGHYNYVDDQGKIQTVYYIADALGFRTVGTNLPVQTYEVPVQVSDTPEVLAAKAEHERLFAEIRARDEELRSQIRQEDIKEVVPIPVEPVIAKTVEVPALPVDGPVATEAIAPVATPVQVQAEPVVPKAAPVAVPAVVAEPTASVHPVVVAQAPVSHQNQYHAQDEAGQYNYGYSNKDSAKVETRTSDGIVRGGYTYIDAEGKLQTVNYISDALGFRVAATNLPVHNIGETAAPVVAPVVTPNVVTPQVSYSYLPYATKYRYRLAPGEKGLKNVKEVPSLIPTITKVNQPAVVSQPVQDIPSVTSSQFHAQDEAGQYNYGYANNLSSKQEVKSADGVVRGGYSYIDANGQVQSVSYISDALGFRAVGTNIPQSNTDTMIKPHVAYSYLPYAVNHQYYY